MLIILLRKIGADILKLYYTIHFFIASVIQLLIILFAEWLAFTQLKYDLSFLKILVFLFMGQVCGYILLWAYKNLKLDKIGIFIIILIFTLINWSLFTSINIFIKQFKNPFAANFLTVIIPFIAFLIYGIYIVILIKNKESKTN